VPDGSAGGEHDAIATLAIARYVSIRAVDGVSVPFQLPPVIGDRSIAVAPGKHRIWAVSAAWPGLPVPTTINCYSIDVTLEAGVRYLLREDAAKQQLLLMREGSEQPEAIGPLVDRPLLPLRDCQWPQPLNPRD
jgi:hypothetical protein